MDKDIEPRKRIPRKVAERLTAQGAPLPTLSQLAEGTGISRRLLRYYFEDPQT